MMFNLFLVIHDISSYVAFIIIDLFPLFVRDQYNHLLQALVFDYSYWYIPPCRCLRPSLLSATDVWSILIDIFLHAVVLEHSVSFLSVYHFFYLVTTFSYVSLHIICRNNNACLFLTVVYTVVYVFIIRSGVFPKRIESPLSRGPIRIITPTRSMHTWRTKPRFLSR